MLGYIWYIQYLGAGGSRVPPSQYYCIPRHVDRIAKGRQCGDVDVWYAGKICCNILYLGAGGSRVLADWNHCSSMLIDYFCTAGGSQHTGVWSVKCGVKFVVIFNLCLGAGGSRVPADWYYCPGMWIVPQGEDNMRGCWCVGDTSRWQVTQRHLPQTSYQTERARSV